MPRKNTKKKQRAKKKTSIASSLVQSMKNGTLGNEDLLSAIQREGKGVTAVGTLKEGSGTGTDIESDRTMNIVRGEAGDAVVVGSKKDKSGVEKPSKSDNNSVHNNTKTENNINTNIDTQNGMEDTDDKISVEITDVDHIKNRIRQKLIQRSKMSDRDVGFKLHHSVGELLENYELISLEVQKHLQSENEQSLYSYCNHDLSDDWIRRYTTKQEETKKEKDLEEEEYLTQSNVDNKELYSNNNNIAAAIKSTKNEKKEEITITSILNNKNKRNTYNSRKKLNALEMQVQMKKAAETQVRKAQLARFLARRAGKINGNGGYF